MTAQVNRDGYLQIDLSADDIDATRHRVPVNAVLILDRSGSMTGPKMDRAREAANVLVNSLRETDSFAMIEFGSDASVLIPATTMNPTVRRRALDAIRDLVPMGGTNMSDAFDLAAAELGRGRGYGRISKVFLASDGQANEGISDRDGLLALARRDFPEATLSTFGIGDDYDEDIMNTFAAQSGGRARYISSPDVLVQAFRDEFNRSAATVARDVRIHIDGVERAPGYDVDGGWLRLPDFAAGEERLVLVKLSTPVRSLDLRYDASGTAFAETDPVVTVVKPELKMQYGRIAHTVDFAQTKAEKERAFDAVRAPVKGW